MPWIHVEDVANLFLHAARESITRRSAQRAFAVPDSKTGFLLASLAATLRRPTILAGAKLHLESGITRPGIAVA